MVLDNLFKHKVNFCLVGHDMDTSEPLLYSKGYHYVSREIENGEMVVARDVTDLYHCKLKPFFGYILSTVMNERGDTDCITIKVNLTCGEDDDEYDIIEYRFEPELYFSLERGEVYFYTYPENLLKEKFSIYVESYAYTIFNIMREMELDLPDPYTPPEETYKQEQCVICLESAPNILCLDCMHIAVCDFCDKKKRTFDPEAKCDVCRAAISRRI